MECSTLFPQRILVWLIPLQLYQVMAFILYQSFTKININLAQDEHESVTAAIQQTCKQLRMDNEELKRRLVAFERVSEENRSLRRSKEETDILRSCLASAQDEVQRLLEEKKKMLQDVKSLQEQLSLAERSRQWTSKR